MTAREVRDYLLDCGSEDAIVYDEYSDAFVGTTKDGVAVYDYNKIVEHLMKEGNTEDKAKGYIDFNIVGAYLGEKTPVILFPPVI